MRSEAGSGMAWMLSTPSVPTTESPFHAGAAAWRIRMVVTLSRTLLSDALPPTSVNCAGSRSNVADCHAPPVGRDTGG